VLLDVKMPRVDGLEVLRRLKADASLRSIPVVMLTSSREESDLVESYRLGVNAYVVKPVEFREFIEAVKNPGTFLGGGQRAPAGNSPPHRGTLGGTHAGEIPFGSFTSRTILAIRS
jgi:CheY-like chemotaxis protein